KTSPKTKLFYVETITNPLMQVAALPEVARFARERGILSAIDNTFATPINFRPAEHGFDLVLHSATKYLNGHSDIVAGVVAGPALSPHAGLSAEQGQRHGIGDGLVRVSVGLEDTEYLVEDFRPAPAALGCGSADSVEGCGGRPPVTVSPQARRAAGADLRRLS